MTNIDTRLVELGLTLPAPTGRLGADLDVAAGQAAARLRSDLPAAVSAA